MPVGMVSHLNVIVPAPCAVALTPHVPYSAHEPASGPTQSRESMVTPLTETVCSLEPVFQPPEGNWTDTPVSFSCLPLVRVVVVVMRFWTLPCRVVMLPALASALESA